MADEDRTFSPSTVSSNRTQMQGNGVGQEEMNRQRAPNRFQTATEEDRTEGWDNDPAGTDAGAPASAGSDGIDEERSFEASGEDEPSEPRFGDGTPANLDPSDIGERDDPELDWGEAEPGAVFSSNHTRRGVKTEAERGQGPRTRARTKDIINRRD